MRTLAVVILAPIALLYALLTFVSPAGTGLGSSLPSYTQEIKIGARQFEFQPSEISVKAGQTVRIIVTNEDNVDHGFTIPALNLTALRTTARKAVLEFTPQQPGTYEFECQVRCGMGHERMMGILIVK